MKAGIQAGGPPVTWTQPIEAGCVLLNPNPELYIKPYPPINHRICFYHILDIREHPANDFIAKKTVWINFNRLKFTPEGRLHMLHLKPLSGKVPFPPSRNDGRSQSHPRIQGFLQGKFRNLRTSGWWLNQPLWKLCSSNWTSSPGIGVNIKKYLSCHHHLLDILGVLKNFYVFP